MCGPKFSTNVNKRGKHVGHNAANSIRNGILYISLTQGPYAVGLRKFKALCKEHVLKDKLAKSKQPCSQLLRVFRSLASEFIDWDMMIKSQAAPQRLVTIIIIIVVVVVVVIII